MDFLDMLEDEPEGETPKWSITLIDADPVAGLPECRWDVEFISVEEVDRLMRQFRKRGQPFAELTPSQRRELRAKVLPRIVRGWQGMVWGNFQKMSEWALKRPHLAAHFVDKDGTPVEIEFNARNLDFVAKEMEHVYYNLIVNTATSTEDAAAELVQKKRDALTSS